MGYEFQNKWKEKIEKERNKVLIWERPFLPPVPEELTEENVVLYIKQIKPQLRRAKSRFGRFISWVLVDLIINWVLVDLVLGGLVVLVMLGFVGGYYALLGLLLETLNPCFSLFLFVYLIGSKRFWAFVLVPLFFAIVALWVWVKRIIQMGTFFPPRHPHPFEFLKETLQLLVHTILQSRCFQRLLFYWFG